MIKKVVVAPDSFKGTLTAVEICSIVEKAFLKVSPQTNVVKIPVADGGEGTVDAYISGLGGTYRTASVSSPMGNLLQARYGVLNDGTAIIEMAAASGLTLVPGELRPMSATSMGTGQLLLDAAQNGCHKIILGIGGSATSDGGLGALRALGVHFLDKFNNDVPPNAEGLGAIQKIDASRLDPLFKDVEILVACDVTNPLIGKNGAAHVFAPQKGADRNQVEMIDAGLLHYNEILTEHTGVDRKDLPGMGAAGGIALSLSAFLNTRMESGIDLILDISDFDLQIKDSDFLITGEGKVDGQSVQGKALAGIAKRAKKANVPVIALVGVVGEGYKKLYEIGITSIFSTNLAAVPFNIAKTTCREDLCFLMESLIQFYNIKG